MKWGVLGFQVLHLEEEILQNLGEDEEEGKLGSHNLSASYKVGSYSHVATWSSPPFMMPHGLPNLNEILAFNLPPCMHTYH